MADLFDQNLPYEPAEAQKISFVKKIKLLGAIHLFGLKIFYYVIIDCLVGLFRLVVPMKPKNIEGQVVLITGGGNGIGKQLARQFAREKCKIAVVDIDMNAAMKTVQEIKTEFKVSAIAFQTDVSNIEQIEKLRLDVESNLGCVDILCNNAGILTTNISLFEGSHADIKRIIDINLTAHFLTLRVFMRGMLDQKRGHIVAISSLLGRVVSPFTITYGATKHGVCGLMDSLRTELNLYEFDGFIKTTTVHPFFVETRQDLVDKASTFSGDIPFINAENLAKVVVDGVRRNRENIYVPGVSKIALSGNLLPRRAYNFARNLPLLSKTQREIVRDHRRNEMLKSLDLSPLGDKILKIN